MKLQRSTLIWLAVAIAAALGAYGLAQQPPPPEAGAGSPDPSAAEQKPLFAFREAEVRDFLLRLRSQPKGAELPAASPVASPNPSSNPSANPSAKAEEEIVLAFSRVGGSPAPGKTQWQFARNAQPPKPANDASVAFLLNALTTGRIDRVLSVPASALKDYGLDRPRAQLQIQLRNGRSHRLALGTAGFNDRFIYAQLDPETAASPAASPPGSPTNSPKTVAIVLVSKDLETATQRPLAEWQPQPIATPSAAPSPSPTPATPSAAPSPSPTPATPSAAPSPSPTPAARSQPSPSAP